MDVNSASDQIVETADYREVVELTKRVVSERSFDLIETLAEQCLLLEALAQVGDK